MHHIEQVPYTIAMYAFPLKNGELSIYGRIILHRKKSEIATGIRCLPEHWDEENSTFNLEHQHSRYLLTRLREFEGKVYDSYINIRNSGQKPSVRIMRDVITGKTEAGSPKLLHFIKEYKEMIEKRGTYCRETISRYTKMRSYLETFLGRQGLRDLRVNELRRSNIVEFQNFLLTERNPILKKPISRVTSNSYIKKLKVVVNEALSRELIERDPFIGFKLENVTVPKVVLTLEEVRLLTEHEFEEEHLNRIKLMYLFSCACGIRFGDLTRLKPENVSVDSDGQHWLDTVQTKTRIPLVVPMFRASIEIYEYFRREYPGSTIFPSVTNQFANRCLKEIAARVGIRKKLCFHSSRNTFGTSMIERGADIYATSKLMGHTSIKSTQVYAKMSQSRVLQVVKAIDKDSE